MKAVLISIQPKWCETIAAGYKTLELRKTAPKLERPFKVYIYCTVKKYSKSDREKMSKMTRYHMDLWSGKVIGEFMCHDCSLLTKAHYGYIEQRAIVSRKFVNNYMGIAEGKELSYSDGLHGWHISDLQIYDEPKPLSKFMKPYGTIIKAFDSPYIQRPPQSWCYVQEVQG